MKKYAALLLSVILLMSMFAACSTPSPAVSGKETQAATAPADTQTVSASAANTTPTPAEPKTAAPAATLTMMVQNHPDAPFKDDWLIWKLHETNANVKLKVSAYQGNWWDSIPLVIASGDLPDLMWMVSSDANKYGGQGALVNLLDHMDKLPNLKAWMEQYPDEIAPILSADGKMYVHPSHGGFGDFEGGMWLYRQDIFKKNNLAVPATFDELYQTLLKLKEIYPDSTPLYFADTYSFTNYGFSFGASSSFSYNPFSKTVEYGPMTDGMKQLVDFVAKAYQNKLIPTEFGNMNNDKRNQLVTTEKTFILYTYYNNIDTFNTTVRQTNPEFTMAFMPPPAAPNGNRFCAQKFFLGEGLTVTTTSRNIDAALGYVDYLFTEQARDTVSWGQEGTTYKTVDGKRQFLSPVADGTTASSVFGLFTSCNFAWVDFDARLSLMSEETRAAYEEGLKFLAPISTLPALTTEESNAISVKSEAIDKKMNEQISKFVIGQLPMSEWDNYIQSLKSLGVEDVLKVYNDAEARRQQALK